MCRVVPRSLVPLRYPSAAFAIAAVLLLLGGVGTANAQGTPPAPVGAWTVTPSLIIGTGGDLDSTGAGFGLAVGRQWTPNLAWEGSFNTLPSVDQGALLTVNSSIWNVTGNVLYYFIGNRAYTPYLAGGIGFGHGSADIPSSLSNLNLNLNDSSTNFLVDLGGGLSKSLAGPLSVRADLRYFIGSDLVPDFWRLGFGVGINLGRR